MELLKDKIRQDGAVKGQSILKVDSFLNHQLDIGFLHKIGEEFALRFKDKKINKILTIEASGIAIATVASTFFDNCPVVFAKKSQSKNLDGELLTSQVTSYTRGTTFNIQVANKFLNKGDNVLIIDDFLASGKALLGLMDIIRQSESEIVGCAIVIEKGFEEGGSLIRKTGVQLESLAIIKAMDAGEIEFAD